MTTAQLTPAQEAWLTALESGNYQQSTDRLGVFLDDTKAEDGPIGFCCLGVGSECYIAAEQQPTLSRRIGGGDSTLDDGYVYEWFDAASGRGQAADIYAPNPVYAWLGLKGPQGDIDWSVVPEGDELGDRIGRKDDLAQLNDSGASFEDIAAFIRRHPRAVFA